jgi:peptidyl-prolyl cis-trans isomerase SurA
MPVFRTVFLRCRRLVAALALAAAIGAIPSPATAQGVAAVVNGEPITTFDIEQRAKLNQVSGVKGGRQEILEELINEKLKIQLLKRFAIDGIDNEVDSQFAGMARRARMSPQVFAEQLTKGNIGVATLKHKIKADIVWSQIIRGRFPSRFQISEKDVMAKLETRGGEPSAAGYDYTLRPILFVIPRGSEQALFESRRREAEALRARFNGCESGVALARQLRDVAVRSPVVRSSADLPPALRDILEKTELGKLSAPEVTAQGVEVYALCGKKPSSAENTPGRREAREELVSAQFKAQSDRYLKELRQQAMIEYR